uniref:Uncharacterized protein n=1 Tax=Anopheles atroparvus TaxID=41427 RepID=A0A182JKG2_ANOAO
MHNHLGDSIVDYLTTGNEIDLAKGVRRDIGVKMMHDLLHLLFAGKHARQKLDRNNSSVDKMPSQRLDPATHAIQFEQFRPPVEVTEQTLEHHLEHDIVAFEEDFSILDEVKRNDTLHQPTQLVRLTANAECI